MGGKGLLIVHDFLVERGGAERVAIELLRSFPDATLITGLFRPSETYPEFSDYHIEQLLDHRLLGGVNHRYTLPFAFSAFARLQLDNDIILCSSSGLSHLTRNRSGRKLVYCHTPARWAYDPTGYFQESARWMGLAGSALGRAFRPLDRRRMLTANCVLANSDVTRVAILKNYGISSEVVHPVSSINNRGSGQPTSVEPGFYLTPSRLLGYKRVDVILDAASRLPQRQFIIVGEGPFRAKLERSAPSNVRFLGTVSDDQLRWLYRKARAVVLSCPEDYGLVPAEAAAFGTPSFVPDQRGTSEQAATNAHIHEYPYASAALLAEALAVDNPTISGRLSFSGERGSAVDLIPKQAAFRVAIQNAVDEIFRS